MTLRNWMDEFGDAGEAPTLVSLALFAAVFLPLIFLAGSAAEWLEYAKTAWATVSTEAKAAGLTIIILGLMAIARIFTLLVGSKRSDHR